MRFGIIQEVQDSICGGSFLKLPSSGTVQQVTSSRWIHWHPALHARDAILVDMDWTHHASPSRTLYLQVWHLQVRCPLLIILESRHICSRAAELSIELNASERIQLKDAQGS